MSNCEEVVRHDSHAGSWYTNKKDNLDKELKDYIDKAPVSPADDLKAVIVPHAGYTYSGGCAAFSYKSINPSKYKTVFILGPSHHYYLTKCALTQCTQLKTPFYNLHVDRDIIKSLSTKTDLFENINVTSDEDEHSIEMQLPYLAKIFAEHKDVKFVPIVVGSINAIAKSLALALSEYFNRPDVLFVISSDFCHWGSRFNYTRHSGTGPIHEFIKSMDLEGVEFIKRLDSVGFEKYINETKNTICGRYPIMLLLALTDLNKNGYRAEMLRYEQSNAVESKNDSSVSYVSTAIYYTKDQMPII